MSELVSRGLPPHDRQLPPYPHLFPLCRGKLPPNGCLWLLNRCPFPPGCCEFEVSSSCGPPSLQTPGVPA